MRNSLMKNGDVYIIVAKDKTASAGGSQNIKTVGTRSESSNSNPNRLSNSNITSTESMQYPHIYLMTCERTFREPAGRSRFQSKANRVSWALYRCNMWYTLPERGMWKLHIILARTIPGLPLYGKAPATASQYSSTASQYWTEVAGSC